MAFVGTGIHILPDEQTLLTAHLNMCTVQYYDKVANPDDIQIQIYRYR
jgi:hypothetical protein